MKNIKAAISNYWSQHTSYGQMWLTAAAVALTVDMAIAFLYGASMSLGHAFGFALVAFFFAVMPDGAYREWESGRYLSSIVIAALCIPLAAVAFYAHLGYGVGIRVGDIQQSGVQNVVHEQAVNSTTEIDNELRKDRNELAELKKKRGWTGIVSADSLRAQLTNLEGDMVFKRSKGCANVTLPDSRAFCDRRADIQGQIADVEAANAIQVRIDTKQAELDAKRITLKNTKFVSSTVVNQTDVGAQLYLAVTGSDPAKALSPDKTTRGFTNIFIVASASFAFLSLAAVGLFLAGRNRRHDCDQPTTGFVRGQEPTTQPAARNMVVTQLVDDSKFAELIASIGRRQVAA